MSRLYPLPEQKVYTTQEGDCPWMERGGGVSKRGADRHYPLMVKEDIVTTIVKSRVWNPAKDAHLWLWATNNHLKDALWVMEALGFTYKTNAVWIKLRDSAKVHLDVRKAILAGEDLATVMRIGLATGLGQYLRGQHELLLLGTRGFGAQVRTDRRDVPSVILAPRGKHSRKPDAAYAMIKDRSKGPHLSMFTREPRELWDVWGPMEGHKFLVKAQGKIRSGHQTYAEALRWCRVNGVLEGLKLDEINRIEQAREAWPDFVLADGITVVEV